MDSKSKYLSEPNVIGFIAFLAGAISGKIRIDHKINIKSRSHTTKENRQIQFENIEDGYQKYIWNRKSYSDTATTLQPISDALKKSYAGIWVMTV